MSPIIPLTPLEILLTELERLDIKLWVEGDKLRFDAPPGALTAEMRARLQTSKPDLIRFLDEAKVYAPGEGYPFMSELERAGIHPLSFAQRHFGLMQARFPKECFYNVPFGFRISGPLDVAALQSSLNALCMRHDFLRTTLNVFNDEVRQIVSPRGEIPVHPVDLRHVPRAEHPPLIQREVLTECHLPFDLSCDCSVRVRLLTLADQEHILLLCLHNTAFDTGSLRALLHEIECHYQAFTTREPVDSLPELPMQYAGCVRWQQALLAGDLESRLIYWRDWFTRGEPPPLTWAIAGRQTPSDTYAAGTLWCELSAELTLAIKQLSLEQNVTVFITLVSAYAMVLSRHSGYTDVVLGTTLANRNHWKFEPIIGSLLNILALRFDLAGEWTFTRVLQQTRSIVMDAFAHQDIPFGVIAPTILTGTERTTPLFRTVFSFLGELTQDELKLAGVKVSFMEEIHGESMFPDLYPTVWERQTPDGLALTSCWQYKRGYMPEHTVASMTEDFKTILGAMVLNPSDTLSSVNFSKNDKNMTHND